MTRMLMAEAKNWNAFWFREGEGAKVSGSNGRAGQGKNHLLPDLGAARAVLGLTVRRSDGKCLLMGRRCLQAGVSV